MFANITRRVLPPYVQNEGCKTEKTPQDEHPFWWNECDRSFPRPGLADQVRINIWWKEASTEIGKIWPYTKTLFYPILNLIQRNVVGHVICLFAGKAFSKWVLSSLIHRTTVSNKNTHLANFETCVFRGYLRNRLSYKNVLYIYLHPCLKSFQMKNNFWNPVSKSADIFKNAVFPEQSKLLEKIHQFEKIKETDKTFAQFSVFEQFQLLPLSDHNFFSSIWKVLKCRRGKW